MIRGLCWLLAFLPMTGQADPTQPTDLLARIRQSGHAQFRYQETRQLELASTPWHGQGYMLSGADGSLVKLQLQPTRIIMAITQEHMYYWDPAQNQRHSAPLDYADPAAEQIKVFRSILQGQIEQLQANYDFSADNHSQHWTLRLTPKPEQADAEIPTIEISGDQDDQQRRISIRQADGESTEYRMLKTSEGLDPKYSLQSLA
jgi:hypothetical protein